MLENDCVPLSASFCDTLTASAGCLTVVWRLCPFFFFLLEVIVPVGQFLDNLEAVGLDVFLEHGGR